MTSTSALVVVAFWGSLLPMAILESHIRPHLQPDSRRPWFSEICTFDRHAKSGLGAKGAPAPKDQIRWLQWKIIIWMLKTLDIWHTGNGARNAGKNGSSMGLSVLYGTGAMATPCIAIYDLINRMLHLTLYRFSFDFHEPSWVGIWSGNPNWTG